MSRPVRKAKPGEPMLAKVLLSEPVLKELSKSVPGFSRAGLLADLFTHWSRLKGADGQSAFARALVEEFDAAPKGSVVRQRILDMMIRLVNWHSDDVHARPVEDMSEEELVAAIDASMPRLAALSRYSGQDPLPVDDPLDPAVRLPETAAAAETVAPEAAASDTFPPPPAEEEMGARIRRHRLRLGFSIADLVVRACLTRRMIREIEIGTRIPTLEVRQSIARAIGVTLRELDET